MEKAEAEEAEKEEMMPLRVAEQDGYIYAVNKCIECPFISYIKTATCGIDPEKRTLQHSRKSSIPVWCPLPIYQMVRHENAVEAIKMRGKHPENIEDMGEILDA